MEIIKPPIFQAGFSPILLKCKGEVKDPVTITISSGDFPDFSISSMLIKEEQTFNLAAYVQSLFKGVDTQLVSYTLTVNGTPLGDTFYAMRSAAQVGYSADLFSKVGGFLTDMKYIDVWEGYPREVSVLAEDGFNVQIIRNGEPQNVRLDNGLKNVEVGCGDSELTVYTNAATWNGYNCQLEQTTFFFTVHVGDRTAKLSGVVSLIIKKPNGQTYTKTASYSGFQDVHFEIPMDENIVAISVTANGALDTNSVQIAAALQPYREREIPTVTCAMPVSYSIFTQNSLIALGKNSSRLLSLTLNQPIT